MGRHTVVGFASSRCASPAKAALWTLTPQRFAPLLRLRDFMRSTPMVFEVRGNVALTERVSLRLAADEKERLKSDAILANLSVSEIVRRHYFGKPIIANADLAMIKEMRRMGGLMKHLHNESDGSYSAQTSAAISSIVKYIDSLTASTKRKK